MAGQTFHINGHVVDQKTGHGVDELRVEAWDKDVIVDDLVGSALTNRQGSFRLEFTSDYFSELFLDRHPDLFFKVFQGQTLIKSTEDTILWNVNQGETEVTIEVDQQEAESVGLAVSLRRLTGGEQTLVFTMLGSEFASVTTGKLKQARDLALLEPEDWERVLEAAGSPAPEGIPTAEYARRLAMEAVAEFPHAAFVQRATHVPKGIPAELNTIQPLLEINANAMALDFDKFDLTAMNETDQSLLREAHADLQRFANLHPGLGLQKVFSNRNDTGKTVELVRERVGWLSTVFDLNPDIDFLNLDYLPDSADLKDVQFGDLPKEARRLVLQDLKAHQRIYTVTNNAIPAREIMQAGFHSASAIALTRESDFAEKTGLPKAEARAYHAAALEASEEDCDSSRLRSSARV